MAIRRSSCLTGPQSKSSAAQRKRLWGRLSTGSSHRDSVRRTRNTFGALDKLAFPVARCTRRAHSWGSADGEEFPVEATISQVKTASETLYSVILRDVSVRKQTEDELRQAQKMEAAGHSQGELPTSSTTTWASSWVIATSWRKSKLKTNPCDSA